LSDADFIQDLETFIKPVNEAGLLNSLSQTLLKLTLPGVPDFYQGTELWDFSLVDPDNRRPVDFAARRSALTAAKEMSATEAWNARHEGTAKIWLIQRVLALRSRRPELFAGSSSYEPLLTSGARGHHAVTFIRSGKAIVVVPRLTVALNNDWADTVIALPGAKWKNELTGEQFNQDMVALSALLRHFPVALLVRQEGR
jgi:(1->4)-alpha-D-glucan 1-alpha-D-glucosylmutase